MQQFPLFWTKYDYPNIKPKIGAACISLIDRNNEHIIFGGEEHPHMFIRKQFKPNESKAENPTKDIETTAMDKIYIWANGTLTEKKTTGKVPTFRSFFGYAYSSPFILVHGGAYSLNATKRKYFADMYGLNIDTLCWKRFFIMEAPPHREMHSFVHVNNLYYLYGGFSVSENKIFGDLWCLDCINVPWSSTSNELTGAVWKQIKTMKNSPGPLKGHSTVAYKQYIILFGGIDGTSQFSNSLYFYNTESKEWALQQCKGNSPQGRAFFTFAVVNSQFLIVHGGITAEYPGNSYNVSSELFMYNIATSQWLNPSFDGSVPDPRWGHIIGVTFDSNLLQLIIFGGLNDRAGLQHQSFFKASEGKAYY